MRRCVVGIGLLVLAGLVILLPVGASAETSDIRQGKLVAGEYLWKIDQFAESVAQTTGEFTGMAFRAGSRELAYCSNESGGPSRLFLVSVPEDFFKGDRYPIVAPPEPKSRLLWQAPSGTVLRVPTWVPDGSAIIVRADRGRDTQDLVLVGIADQGQAQWLTKAKRVVELAWDVSDSRKFAYITQDDSGRTVWLQTIPPGKPMEVGAGVSNLYWSLDGSGISWLALEAEHQWRELTYDVESGHTVMGNLRPAREEGTIWSPDGNWCAVVQADHQLVISPATESTEKGEHIDLAASKPVKLLGWSPDSSFVTVLTDHRFLAIGRVPIAKEVQDVIVQGLYFPGRIVTVRWAIQESGGPTWSTGSTGWGLPGSQGAFGASGRGETTREPLMALAVMPTEHPHERMGIWSPEAVAKLVVVRTARQHLGPPEQAAAMIERQQIEINIAVIALTFSEYLEVHNGAFPPKSDVASVRALFSPFIPIPYQAVFFRPGSQREVAVHFVFPPGGKAPEDVMEKDDFPVAVIDYPEGYYATAFAGGRMEIRDGPSPLEKPQPAP